MKKEHDTEGPQGASGQTGPKELTGRNRFVGTPGKKESIRYHGYPGAQGLSGPEHAGVQGLPGPQGDLGPALKGNERKCRINRTIRGLVRVQRDKGKTKFQEVQGPTGPQGYRQQVLERARHGVFDR